MEAELAEDEGLAADCWASVPGHGRKMRLLDGPSCSVLELEDGVLVPFVSDAIESVQEGEIRLNEGFLG